MAVAACAALWRRHKARWQRALLALVPLTYPVVGGWWFYLVATGQLTPGT